MAEWRRFAQRALAAVFLAAALAGCAAPAPHRRVVRIALAASPGLNPDRAGRPSPVVVRIYELEDAGDFRQAGFFDLYDRDRQVLGAAALSRAIVAVRPGERSIVRRELNPRSRHLAVLVAYRNIDRARWRAVLDLPDRGDSAWRLTLDADSVTVAASNAGDAPSATAIPTKENHVLEQ